MFIFVYIWHLFHKFKKPRKVVKNYGLTRLLFGKFFDIENYLQFYSKVLQTRVELYYLSQTFMFGAYFKSLKLVEKSSKTMG